VFPHFASEYRACDSCSDAHELIRAETIAELVESPDQGRSGSPHLSSYISSPRWDWVGRGRYCFHNRHDMLLRRFVLPVGQVEIRKNLRTLKRAIGTIGVIHLRKPLKQPLYACFKGGQVLRGGEARQQAKDEAKGRKDCGRPVNELTPGWSVRHGNSFPELLMRSHCVVFPFQNKGTSAQFVRIMDVVTEEINTAKGRE
jgi:hypothetical protein